MIQQKDVTVPREQEEDVVTNVSVIFVTNIMFVISCNSRNSVLL